MWDVQFFLSSVMLGVGLSMDAFSVSVANGLYEPQMKKNKRVLIVGTFAFFQALMPLVGWLLVNVVANVFTWFERCVPYVALLLLLFIGGKMVVDGIRSDGSTEEVKSTGLVALLVQGIATSIDALSVGFTIESYILSEAVVCAVIIALVTFLLCLVGVSLGKKFGDKLSGKATILGGVILICIGLEIFLTGIL